VIRPVVIAGERVHPASHMAQRVAGEQYYRGKSCSFRVDASSRNKPAVRSSNKAL